MDTVSQLALLATAANVIGGIALAFALGHYLSAKRILHPPRDPGCSSLAGHVEAPIDAAVTGGLGDGPAFSIPIEGRGRGASAAAASDSNTRRRRHLVLVKA